MKLITTLLAVIGIIFFTSCSDVNQDFSPVSPGIEKQNGPGPISPFIYDYMQEFIELNVEEFSSTKANAVVIHLQGVKATSEIIHAFAILEYNSPMTPGTSALVFLGKPSSTTIEIPNFSSENLTGVRVYALKSASGVPISGTYEDYQPFEQLNVSNLEVASTYIKVTTPDWSSDLKESFAELKFKSGNKLVFLERPSSGEFSIPVQDTYHFTDIKLFGLY